jgi:hypothetical protein
MHDMTAFRVSQPSGNSAYIPVFWFTIFFAVITYAAISARAVLNPYEVNHVMDAKRVFSVAIGTVVLWLSIRAADRLSEHGPGAQIFAVLNIAIPGAIGLFIAREAYDLVASGEFATRLALNLRWMLNWMGYFAAGVASFLALAAHRRLQIVIGHNTPDDVARTKQAIPSAYEHADFDFDPRSST